MKGKNTLCKIIVGGSYSRNERFTCQQQPYRNMPVQRRQNPSSSCGEAVSPPCSCRIPRDPLEHMTLAMAYVPWQTWEDTYDVHKGLECGTIFPVLNKPFYGKGGAPANPGRPDRRHASAGTGAAMPRGSRRLCTNPDRTDIEAAALARRIARTRSGSARTPLQPTPAKAKRRSKYAASRNSPKHSPVFALNRERPSSKKTAHHVFLNVIRPSNPPSP